MYMAHVYERAKTWLDPVLVPVERLLYKLTGVDAGRRCAGRSTAWRC